MTTLALSLLDFGHKLKGNDINARKGDREASKSLIHSIKTHGLIVPLAVTAKQPDGKYYVIAGNRRLDALRRINKDQDAVQVPIIEHDGTNALTLSMIENVERAELHAVDRFEVFSALVAGGASVKEIGSKFLLTDRQVNQALALAALSPTLRDAWRDDVIDGETAQAFTLEADHARQEQVYKSLKKRGHFNDYMVKTALIGEQGDAEKMLRIVSIDDYIKAGGAITRDLFAEKTDAAAIATDHKLLKKLYDEKLTATFERIKAEGWKWVEWSRDLPHGAEYWPAKPKADIKEADRAKFGVVLHIGYNGELQTKYGVVKPSEARAKEKKKAAANGKHPPVSNALMQRLSETLTHAAAVAIVHDEHTATAALLAGFASGGQIVDVREDGLHSAQNGQRMQASFETAFKRYSAMTAKQQLKEIAEIAGRALDFQTFSADKPPMGNKAVAILCNDIPDLRLNEALRKRFDAKDYFESVNRELCVAAVAEAVGKDQAAKVAKMKKADAARFCIANVPKTKWLPVELRTDFYDGPKGKRG